MGDLPDPGSAPGDQRSRHDAARMLRVAVHPDAAGRAGAVFPDRQLHPLPGQQRESQLLRGGQPSRCRVRRDLDRHARHARSGRVHRAADPGANRAVQGPERRLARIRVPMRIAAVCLLLSLLAAVAPAQASVAYVGSSASSLGSSGTSSVTMTVPSGVVTGNVMIALVAQNTSGLPAVTGAPSGWTQVLEQNDGNSIGAAVYYRVATSSDVAGTTTYTWTFQQSARSGGLIAAFSGVSTTSPVVASASQANGASGSYTAPSITPGVANTMLLALFAADSGNVTMATPAGTTSAFAGSTGAGPNGIAIGVFYEPLSASTATGQVQSSGNNSATNVGATLVLQ